MPATSSAAYYALSLHDALPISSVSRTSCDTVTESWPPSFLSSNGNTLMNGKKEDRKSTRLNSSHLGISYAVFCLKKKKHAVNKLHHHQAEGRQLTSKAHQQRGK